MGDMEDQPRINVGAGIAWSAAVVLAMLAASYWAWQVIPGDARLPMHWNEMGEVDGYASKGKALLFAPGVAVLIALIFAVVPLVEPRGKNLARSRVLYHSLWAGMLIVFAVVHATIIASAMGVKGAPSTYLIPGLGLLFVVIGNVLGKTRSNFSTGIRTPWTLSSEYSWDKTHRWTGRMWVVVGLAVMASSPFLEMKWQLAVLLGGVMVSTAVAFVMSYVFWRQDPSRER